MSDLGTSLVPAAPPLDVPQPTEPLRNVGAIGTAVASVLTLLVAFAVPLNNAQQLAILGVVATCGPIVIAMIGRGKVYSPETVRQLLRASSSEKPRNSRSFGPGGAR